VIGELSIVSPEFTVVSPEFRNRSAGRLSFGSVKHVSCRRNLAGLINGGCLETDPLCQLLTRAHDILSAVAEFSSPAFAGPGSVVLACRLAIRR